MASLTGTIIKGIAGFYYVATVESGIYACKARGIFRKEKMTPLVGDRVLIDVLDEKDKEANLVQIEPRRTGSNVSGGNRSDTGTETVFLRNKPIDFPFSFP